jgi:hypothetical protein
LAKANFQNVVLLIGKIKTRTRLAGPAYFARLGILGKPDGHDFARRSEETLELFSKLGVNRQKHSRVCCGDQVFTNVTTEHSQSVAFGLHPLRSKNPEGTLQSAPRLATRY